MIEEAKRELKTAFLERATTLFRDAYKFRQQAIRKSDAYEEAFADVYVQIEDELEAFAKEVLAEVDDAITKLY